MQLVPNSFPSLPDPHDRRLAIVGEAPGLDEEVVAEPFVGPSGKLLRLVLSSNGINPKACFIGNICQTRPPTGEIESFDWAGQEIQNGLAQLSTDLSIFKPNVVLSLGRYSFRYFNPDKCYQGKPSKNNPTGYVVPIQNWRGSVFIGTGGYKTVACFHPAYIQRVWSDIAYFRADVSRAVRHSASPALNGVIRTGILRPTVSEVIAFLSNLRANSIPASFDIEGYSDAIGVTMLSVCPTPTSGIVIPFYIDGQNYWTEDEEALVWQHLSTWLADPTCPKKCHQAFYETFVLGWRHKCVVDGIISDTMMKHWEFFNELEKSLAVAVSLWIEEPYYKDDRLSNNSNVKLLYNFKDSACTEEVDRAIEPALRQHPATYTHFEFNVSLIPAFTYLHLRGCRFDSVRANEHRRDAENKLALLIEQIDEVTLPVLGHTFNPKSTDDKAWYLYDFLNLKPYTRYGKTTKEVVMLRYYNKTRDQTLQRIIQAVNLRTRISDIGKLTPNDDGRIRTTYELVGTVTGRSSSRDSSATDLQVTSKGNLFHVDYGTNLQNVTKALRDTFIVDSDDYTFFQADLSGADAWTVAADLFALKSPFMLEDLKLGIKPSKLLLRMLEVLESNGDPSIIARLPSHEAKLECDKVIIPDGILPDGRPGDWFYTSLKRVQHGTNYDGQADTISATIFKDSDGAIDIPASSIEKYQRLYRLRYNTPARTDWMSRHLLESGGVLQTAVGIRRRFYGIRNSSFIDDEIIRQALASEPQAVTTYVTNRALLNLWNDPTNRRRSGALFVEPLLQIHDALAGQFPTRLRDYAAEAFDRWFNVKVIIHGVEVTIPADIKVGRSWGDCKHKL